MLGKLLRRTRRSPKISQIDERFIQFLHTKMRHRRLDLYQTSILTNVFRHVFPKDLVYLGRSFRSDK